MENSKVMSLLTGATLNYITGLSKGSEEVTFSITKDGRYYEVIMYHIDDCCEDVELEDFDTTLKIGSTGYVGALITEAREDVNPPHSPVLDGNVDSYTYTFYNILTSKGYLNLRWLGVSNGYYSERVDFQVREILS